MRADVPFRVQGIDIAVRAIGCHVAAVEAGDRAHPARLDDVRAVIQLEAVRHVGRQVAPPVGEAEVQAVECFAAEAGVEDFGGVDRAVIGRPLQRGVDRWPLALAVEVRRDDGVAREIIGCLDAIDVKRGARRGRQASIEARRPVLVAIAREDALKRSEARSFWRIFRRERHHRAGLEILVAIFSAGEAGIHQDADVADPGFPTIADQQRHVGVHLVRQFGINAARETGDGEAIKVERATGLHVDLAGQAGFQLVGRTGLVDVDTADKVRRNILEREGGACCCEDIAAIEGGKRIRQATNGDRRCLATRTIGDLDAGHALKRFDNIIVGQLADIFRHDRIDDLR